MKRKLFVYIFLNILFITCINSGKQKNDLIYLDKKQNNDIYIWNKLLLSEDGNPITYSTFQAIDSDLKTAVNLHFDKNIEEDVFVDFHIYFKFKTKYNISKIAIYNGYQKNLSIFEKNQRVKDLSIIISYLYEEGNDIGNIVYSTNIIILDITNAQIIQFPKGIQGNDIYFRINSTYPGTKYEDIAISEIEFYNEKGKYEIANLKEVMKNYKDYILEMNFRFFPQLPIACDFNKNNTIYKTLNKLGIELKQSGGYLEFCPKDHIIYFYKEGDLAFFDEPEDKINPDRKNAIPIGEWYFNEFGVVFLKVKGGEWQKLNREITDYAYEKFAGTDLEIEYWTWPFPEEYWPFNPFI